MTYNSSSRNGATVRLVVIHTGEGILRAADMARFLDNNPGASAHATCDADTTIAPMVPYERAAWTLGSGNPISDNIELCAFAGFTREQWLSTGNVISPKGTTVRNPRAILRRGALWAAERCRARGIPIRKLTVEQVRAGWSGICGHIDWNLAHNAGDHWDPGPGFPWDVFINDANGGGDDIVTPEDIEKVAQRTATLIFHHKDVEEPDYGKGVGLVQLIAKRYYGIINYINQRTTALEAKVSALAGTLSDDEANIIASVRQGGVDPVALAAALAPHLPEGGATKDDVEQALRNVLRTGTEGEA